MLACWLAFSLALSPCFSCSASLISLICTICMHIDRYMNSASILILYTVLLALSPSSSPSGARILWVSSIDSLPRRQLHGPVPLSPPFAGKQAKLLMHGMAWPPTAAAAISLFATHDTHYLLVNYILYMMVCHTLTRSVCVCCTVVSGKLIVLMLLARKKERVWRSVSAWINQSIISICLITSLPLNGMKEGAATGGKGVFVYALKTQRGLLPLQLQQPAAL
jgi:hypothetical protein